jgi:hypothetical protein
MSFGMLPAETAGGSWTLDRRNPAANAFLQHSPQSRHILSGTAYLVDTVADTDSNTAVNKKDER